MSKAYIWDLDGTLLDSYGVIVSSLHDAYAEQGIQTSPAEIEYYAIKYSVNDYIRLMEERTGKPFANLKERYNELSRSRKDNIVLMSGAREVLRRLKEAGHRNFVVTHRGETTMAVLNRLGITEYFEDIVTALSGFPRKPAPEAVEYLLSRYGLDPARTYFVGDRPLDMQCAKNAGVVGVLYIPKNGAGEETGLEDYIVRDLLRIPDLP